MGTTRVLIAGFTLLGATAAGAAPPHGLDPLERAPGTLEAELRPAAASTAVTTGNPLWAVPMRTLSETRDRPIFSPSRRPPPPALFALASIPAPPSPAAKPAEPDHPLLALIGTVRGGTQDIGIFIEEASKNALRLRPGEAYSGWMLRAVKRGEARFEKDGRTATLNLPSPGGRHGGPKSAGRSASAGEAATMRGDSQHDRRR